MVRLLGVVMLFGVATLAAFAGLGVALLLNEGWDAKAAIVTGVFLFSALYTGIDVGRIIRTGEI
jgi:uncharacterized membrane protein (DUF441 family)